MKIGHELALGQVDRAVLAVWLTRAQKGIFTA